jgi:hypothetical protein
VGSSDSINDFQEMHILIVWDELRLRFGFDLKAWKNDFSSFLASQPRNTTETDAFIQFGNRRINPVLNSILRRNELYPTFNNLILYVVRQKRNQKK